ncbi:MAG: glycoside hydrolase family 55 protein, partial [Pirellula sp.]|nr:glycoside hydrolase family 55 protein [Pirellula sp.]
MNTIERNQERMNAFALAIGMFWILCGSLPSSVFANETHGARLSKEDQIRFPVSSWVLNVKESPYNAKGDGKTDDTLAIQRALNDLMGSHRVLYFPSGTYLISKTLQWTNRKADGTNAWGYNWLQGQGTD